MKIRIPRPSPILPVLLALAGCSPFHFEKQHIALRHDAESDRLELAVLHLGVHAPSERAVAEARGFLQRLAAGGRLLYLWEWPFYVDLDDPELGEAAEAQEGAARVLDGIAVEEAGLFLDESERPGAYQRFRAPASDTLALANRAWNRCVLELAAEGELMPELDEASREAWVRRAQGGGTWLALGEDGSLTVDLPASPAGAARLLEGLAKELSRGPDENPGLPLLAALSALEVTDVGVRLRWRPDTDGWIHVEIDGREPEADTELREALEAEMELARRSVASCREKLLAP